MAQVILATSPDGTQVMAITISETNVSSIPFWIGSFVCASIAIFSAFKFFPAYQEQKEREKRNDTMYK